MPGLYRGSLPPSAVARAAFPQQFPDSATRPERPYPRQDAMEARGLLPKCQGVRFPVRHRAQRHAKGPPRWHYPLHPQVRPQPHHVFIKQFRSFPHALSSHWVYLVVVALWVILFTLTCHVLSSGQ